MDPLRFINGRIVLPDRILEGGEVEVVGRRIAAVRPSATSDGPYMIGPLDGGEPTLRRNGVGLMLNGTALASGWWAWTTAYAPSTD